MPKDILEYLRAIHGIYNFSIFFLFIYQGILGIKIRRARRAEKPLPINAIKRHRRQGPVFALLGIAGYVFGAILGYLDDGLPIKYKAHFLNGTLIAILIITTYLISRKIKAGNALRTPHAIIGILILLLYILQILFGIGIFL
jgi:hypothetical protein